jgi:hypothetical protein
MGILDPMDDHDPFAWLCGGEPPSGVPELLDPAETPVTFAPAPGALTGPRPSPDRDADRRGLPRDRFALDDAELSCIARTLLLDDGAEGFQLEAGTYPARGHDEERRKARRLFRCFPSRAVSAEPAHPWQSLFDDDAADACFLRMAEVKERDVRSTTGVRKRRIDGTVSAGHLSLTEDVKDASSRFCALGEVGEPSNAKTLERNGEKNREKKKPANRNRHASTSPVSNKPVSATSSPPPGRSSRFRGVTKHRWTGRYEAHLWDSSFERNVCERKTTTSTPFPATTKEKETLVDEKEKNDGGPKRRAKGKQVYLGGYAREEEAARAYDKAAIKYWGQNANLNFPRTDYLEWETEIANTATAQYVAQLRRGSTGFSRGASRFRGVTRHHQHGRWEARIGRVLGNRYLYLGTFASEEEAARAYDVAALHHRGPKAVTNFARESYGVAAAAAAADAAAADENTTNASGVCRRETAVLGSVVRASLVGTARHAGSDPGSLAFDAFEEPLEGEVVAGRN